MCSKRTNFLLYHFGNCDLTEQNDRYKWEIWSKFYELNGQIEHNDIKNSWA
jgi:hypothetical protein